MRSVFYSCLSRHQNQSVQHLVLRTTTHNSGLLAVSSSSSSSRRNCSSTHTLQSSSSVDAMVAVDVTKSNFSEVLPVVKEALERCAFFAVDCEMTGLHTDTAKHEWYDDHHARYSKIADSSKSYIITQYGLSCFEKTGPNSYEASTFNFFVFPQPHDKYCRRFMCDAGSLAFLADHGFDFNTCIRQGVPYMPARTRDWQLLQVDRTYDREPAVPSTLEDVAFVQELVTLVKDWLAGRDIQDSGLHLNGGGLSSTDEDDTGPTLSADENAAAAAATAAAAAAGGGDANGDVPQLTEQLLLAPLNAFRRLLAHQEFRKPQFGVTGHPGFRVSKVEGDDRCLKLVRATAQQAEAFAAQERAERIARIHAAAGFAAVFDAMKASNKPCVGHNCMLDISFAVYNFADSYMPATWTDYKKMVRAWHRGGIWDTKYITRRLPDVFQDNTALSQVFAATNQPTEQQIAAMQPLLDAATCAAAAASCGDGSAAAAAAAPAQLPVITHAPGFDKYRNLAPGEAAHEAGYDAFMTGATFAALLPLVVGKIASDPTHELAVAHAEALQRAAEAAAQAAQLMLGGAVGGGSSSSATLLAPTSTAAAAASQQQRVLQEQQGQAQNVPASNGNIDQHQQQQTKQPTDKQPSHPQPQQQQPLPHTLVVAPDSLLGPVSGIVGRLNLTYSDLPYAALWGPDPIPERPFTFQLSGLQQGYRADDVWRMMKRQGLGTRSVTPVDSSSCLVTVKPEFAGAAAAAVAEMGSGLLLTPWQEYATARYSRKLPEEQQEAPPASAAAAMDVDGVDGAGATEAAAATTPGGSSKGVKRPRVAMEQEAADDGGRQAPQRSCSIM